MLEPTLDLSGDDTVGVVGGGFWRILRAKSRKR
jgi:hypothetical protein